MLFIVYTLRREGRLLPRHVMWSTKVEGERQVKEVHDTEIHRTVRHATVIAGDGFGAKVVAGPLLDAQLIGARRGWWTMTGWERVQSVNHADPRAYQQSWVLIPADEDHVPEKPAPPDYR